MVKKHFQEEGAEKNNFFFRAITEVRKIDKTDFLQFTGLQIIDTIGHSSGHTVYYHSKDRVLITGDLFTEKIVFSGVR